MGDGDVFLICMFGAACIVLFFVWLIGGDSGSNQSSGYRSTRYRRRRDDWVDQDFDGFHDNDDGPWNEDKY